MLDIARFLVGVSSPALSIVLVASAANDICANPGRCIRAAELNPGHPFGFGLLLAIHVAVISAAVLFHYGKKPLDADVRRALVTYVIWTVLAAALAASVFAVVLDLKPSEFVISHWALYLVEAINAVLMQLFALLTVHSLRPRTQQ